MSFMLCAFFARLDPRSKVNAQTRMIANNGNGTVQKIRLAPSCESQSALTAALVALEETVIQTEGKVTELCEPMGDVMYKYLYIFNVMNPNTKELHVQTFVGQTSG